MNNKHYSETLYSKIYLDYDRTRWENKGRLIDTIQKRLVISILNEFIQKKDSKILDLGAGTGRFLVLLAKRGYEPYGIDISEEMLSIAKNKLEGYKSTLKVANANNLPFQEKFFDLIISFRVLIHISNYEGIIKELQRTLKNGGYVLLEVNNRNIIYRIIKILRKFKKSIVKKDILDPTGVSFKKFKGDLSKNFIEVEKVYYQFFIPEFLYRKSPSFLIKYIYFIDKFFLSTPLKKFSTRMIFFGKKQLRS